VGMTDVALRPEDNLRREDATSDAGASVEQAGEIRSARIESLRALAALGVVIAHAWGTSNGYVPQLTQGSYFDRVIFGGGLGVLLFFALSGYLLFWPFAKRYWGNGRPIDLGRYALNRVLRIMPLYYVVIIAVLLLQKDDPTSKDWILHLTWAENFSRDTIATSPNAINGVVWSVVVELHFYLLLPILAWVLAKLAGRSLGRAALILGALAAASFALRWFTFYDAEPPTRIGQEVYNPLVRFSILSTFFFFFAGMSLCFLRIAWEKRPPRLLQTPLGLSGLWVLASAAVWLVIPLNYGREYLAFIASFLLVGACVLPLRHGILTRGLEWKPLAAIGIVSYSLYLWHIPVITELYPDIVEPSSFPVFLAIALAVCLAWSFASYYLIESPFLRLRRRWGSTAGGGGLEGGPVAPDAEAEREPARA
jgi:peptidoglycan/LPS O-acetylase OafA/YrhL